MVAVTASSGAGFTIRFERRISGPGRDGNRGPVGAVPGGEPGDPPAGVDGSNSGDAPGRGRGTRGDPAAAYRAADPPRRQYRRDHSAR